MLIRNKKNKLSLDLQRDNLFYTATSYCIPATLMRIPYSFMEATVWIVFTYFEVGLAANPGRHVPAILKSNTSILAQYIIRAVSY